MIDIGFARKHNLSHVTDIMFARKHNPRLRNHNATDDGNVDFIYFRKISRSRLCKVVDLLAQKLLNDMTLDWYPLMNSSLHTRQS